MVKFLPHVNHTQFQLNHDMRHCAVFKGDKGEKHTYLLIKQIAVVKTMYRNLCDNIKTVKH